MALHACDCRHPVHFDRPTGRELADEEHAFGEVRPEAYVVRSGRGALLCPPCSRAGHAEQMWEPET